MTIRETPLMSDKELEEFEETRDIEVEILQGVDDMLANNAAKRTVVTGINIVSGHKENKNNWLINRNNIKRIAKW